VIEERLGWSADELRVEEVSDSRGPGNVVMIELEHAAVSEVVTAFGARGVRAEAVAEDAVNQARGYLDSDVPVGEHLADQLLLPLVLAGGGTYRAAGLSLHTTTNIDVIKAFLDVRIETQHEPGGDWQVTVCS
jgi:RNA 3'-terminal phosphate cyclase (ATP)